MVQTVGDPVRSIGERDRPLNGPSRSSNGRATRAATRPEPLHRVNVNFTGEAYDALAELARQRGKTVSEVLRDAIALERWVEQAYRDGGRVLVERGNQLRELVRI